MSDDKLKNLRDKIDQIDSEIQNLLTQRAQISLEVRDAKQIHEAKLKPGREAQIIRALIDRHSGSFPKLELIRIWREILSTSLQLQGSFDLAVYKPDNKSGNDWGYLSSARRHFGSNTPMTTYSSQRRVIEAVLENECSAGILPIPTRNEENPWWRYLAVQGNTVKNGIPSKPARIIARLPFAAPKTKHGPSRNESKECVVISKGEADPSGLDETYIVLDFSVNISSSRIETRLTENNLASSILSIWHDSEAPERWLCLLCISGFIIAEDDKLNRFAGGFSEILNQITILGSYAKPFNPDNIGSNNI